MNEKDLFCGILNQALMEWDIKRHIGRQERARVIRTRKRRARQKVEFRIRRNELLSRSRKFKMYPSSVTSPTKFDTCEQLDFCSPRLELRTYFESDVCKDHCGCAGIEYELLMKRMWTPMEPRAVLPEHKIPKLKTVILDDGREVWPMDVLEWLAQTVEHAMAFHMGEIPKHKVPGELLADYEECDE